MGTVNVLEAARKLESVRAIIVVTSDKCYYPVPATNGYTEQDRLGGFDPYSASKACAEIVTFAYTQSFFDQSPARVGAATVHAGNVIGGGDWAEDRIVRDAIRALERGEILTVRNPDAIRPWQHVLEPLTGYLMLAERLYEDGAKWSGAWNFGPSPDSEITVGNLADLLVAHWGAGSWRHGTESAASPETVVLRLDSAKALRQLGWQTEGVDFDAPAVANARRKGLAVRAGALEDQRYPEASFDLVHMSHVIEHVPDPLATLAEIRRVLRPGGTLVLATPNSRSWGHTKFGRSWLHLEPPRHLHLFNRSTLHAAAVRTGFGSISIRSNLRGVAGVLGESRMIRRSGCGDPYHPPVSLYGFAMATIEALALRFRPEAGEELLLEARK